MLPFNQLSYWEKESFWSHIDSLIVGSGIVGLCTAINLKLTKPNKKVVVLERGYLPTGASTKNAGFACIGSASELLSDLECHSEQLVFKTVQDRWEGLVKLRELLGDEGMEFQKLGSHELFSIHEKEESEKCISQINYLNQRLSEITGINDVYKVDPSVCRESGFMGFRSAISNGAEGQLNTGKMMQALIYKAQSIGVQIVNGIEIQAVESSEVLSNYGRIAFGQLAICTNGLAQSLLPKEDVQAARAQVIVTSPVSDLKVKGIFHFDQGYYYFRNIGDRILLGGARNLNFKAEETDELNTSDQIINHLSSILENQIIPNAAFTIDHQWAGTMGLGKQKSPIVKAFGNNLFCGVRLGGMGVAIGSLVGERLAKMMS